MISLNITTVEQIKIMNIHDHENALLGEMFPWWTMGARRATIREWDAEWGALNTEGNIWWRGSARVNWESVMGKRVWAWFRTSLPFPSPFSLGLNVGVNSSSGTCG